MSESGAHPIPAASPARCPRCARRFACGAGGPGACACSRIELGAATLAALRARYADCLCQDCLAQLAAGAALDQTQPGRG